MIVELGVGILAICAVGCTVHLYRRRMKGEREQAEQDKMRETGHSDHMSFFDITDKGIKIVKLEEISALRKVPKKSRKRGI